MMSFITHEVSENLYPFFIIYSLAVNLIYGYISSILCYITLWIIHVTPTWKSLGKNKGRKSFHQTLSGNQTFNIKHIISYKNCLKKKVYFPAYKLYGCILHEQMFILNEITYDDLHHT